jgi:1-acyl-sn-glycerol-3-phosphate acyltransferase
VTGPRPGPDPHDPALTGDLTFYISGLAFVARTSLRCLARPRVVGALDQVPREGPLIVASNHLSNADGVLIDGWLVPALGRRIHWLGKREMFSLPGSGLALGAASVHPVDREGADVEAFRLAERILAAGNVLLAFPEGTRSPTGGLQRPRDGLALLAMRTGAPILPIGISGTDRFWPRGDRPHFGERIGLRVGEAFRLADVLGDAAGDRRRAKALATDAIMTRIAALLPPRHRGVYGGSPTSGGIRPVPASEQETEPPAGGADAGDGVPTDPVP